MIYFTHRRKNDFVSCMKRLQWARKFYQTI